MGFYGSVVLSALRADSAANAAQSLPPGGSCQEMPIHPVLI